MFLSAEAEKYRYSEHTSEENCYAQPVVKAWPISNGAQHTLLVPNFTGLYFHNFHDIKKIHKITGLEINVRKLAKCE